MRKQCAETYKKQCRMITYCLRQMLILQKNSRKASTFQGGGCKAEKGMPQLL